MRYEITEKSKAEAIRVFERKFALTPEYTTSAFSAALDALLVPVQGEGWVEKNTPGTRHDLFKGDYNLCEHKYSGWKLYDLNGKFIKEITREGVQPSEAQAWADRVIVDRERKLQKFGPGTRLRAANGNELRVLTDVDGLFCAVNLTQNRTFKNCGSFWFDKDGESLRTALLESGATVIEEGE